MFYTYILRSIDHPDRYYIGHTAITMGPFHFGSTSAWSALNSEKPA